MKIFILVCLLSTKVSFRAFSYWITAKQRFQLSKIYSSSDEIEEALTEIKLLRNEMNDKHLRLEAAKMFGVDWAKEWLSKSLYNLVHQVEDVLPCKGCESKRRISAIKLCPDLKSTMKDYFSAISLFMQKGYGSSLPTDNEKRSDSIKRYLDDIDKKIPVNDEHKRRLNRLLYAIPLLEVDDESNIDWEPMLCLDGPGVLLTVVTVKAKAWMNESNSISDYFATINDPLVYFPDEIEVHHFIVVIVYILKIITIGGYEGLGDLSRWKSDHLPW